VKSCDQPPFRPEDIAPVEEEHEKEEMKGRALLIEAKSRPDLFLFHYIYGAVTV
jgi:hypothetical protein